MRNTQAAAFFTGVLPYYKAVCVITEIYSHKPDISKKILISKSEGW